MKQQSLQAFLDACGSHEPLCLEVTGAEGQAPSRQVLRQPFALVGRYDRADVCLADQGVSRRHALVQVIAGRAYCLDLGSRTGTYWNGGRGRGWLPRQAPFHVGPYRLSVERTAPTSVALPPDGWDPLARGSVRRYALPSVSLHIRNHGTTVDDWQMNRVLAIVGSAADCKVRLRGPGISKYHCALVCTPTGTWVIDLQRRDGVVVNGTHINHGLLEDGDRLQLGSFTVCIGYDSPPLAEVPDPEKHTTGTNLVASLLGMAGGLQSLPKTGPLASAAMGTEAGMPAASWSPDLFTGMLRQFGEMQQHMFEQSLTMMFRMFRTMHTEQVGILREEMARLEELNRELNALLTERAKIASPVPQLPAPAAVASPAADTPAKTSLAAPPEKTAAPTAPTAPTAPAATDKAVPAPQPAAPADLGSPDLHIWLCQRMEAIQQERQGLWDRIVGLIGKKD
jgi:pSer/pThr/pTyr-binding forkhead associated (FHA) protein